MAIIIAAIIGFLLSLYAFYVKRAAKSSTYKAACDISPNISCTKVLTSKEGRLLGFSNTIGGLIFYPIVLFSFYFHPPLVKYLALLAVLGSLYLAYLQYFKLRNFCLLCTGIYVVNIAILVASL